MGPVTKKELCLNHTLKCTQEQFRPLARGKTHVSDRKKKKNKAKGFFCLCKCIHCTHPQHFSPQELMIFSVVETGCKCWHNPLYFSSFHHRICLLLLLTFFLTYRWKNNLRKKQKNKKTQPNTSEEVFQYLFCPEQWLIVKISLLPLPMGN